MTSDGIGFFILHGDIYRYLFYLLLHSTAFMSFSGRLYFYLIKRLQVMKMVEKGHFIRYYEKCKILVQEKYGKSKTLPRFEPA